MSSVTLFVQANELALHVVLDGGAQGTPLIFLNSLGSDLRIWNSVIELFDESSNVPPLVRYDLRGHGLSDCPAAPYTIRDHTTDLAELIDYLGHQQVILIGISVGGMIVMDYTLMRPDRVKALVLCDTAPRIGTEEMWNTRITALRANGMESLAEAILARWFSEDFGAGDHAALHGYYNMLTRTPLEGYVGTCAAIRDADLWPDIAKIAIPALVMCGADDQATPPDLGRRLATALPHAHFVAIENAGHLPCVEQPDRVVAEIQKFIASLAKGRVA